MEVKKIKQGDVLCYTWGSEQTNVDFFYVRKRTPKCVYLIPVPSETVGIPKKGSFVREVKPKLSGCVEGYESRKKIGMSYQHLRFQKILH